MKIFIKTPAEIALMKEGGHILGLILDELREFSRPGITTMDIEKKAVELFKEFDVKPSFLGYKGYPAYLCANVNEEVVHGIPGNRILCDGDILSIDCGVYHKGLHTDSAITIGVGNISPEVEKFISAGEETLYKAILIAQPGIMLSKISAIIEGTLLNHNFTPVRELTGHGVGKYIHEDPLIFNYVDEKMEDVELKEGMTLAIEPIYVMGGNKIKTKADKWTIVTRDGSFAAQVEHTIAITASGSEILTKRPTLDPIYYNP